MTLDEARRVIQYINDKIGEDSKMIWGAQISPDMDKTMRVLLILTGVKSSQISGKESRKKDEKLKEIESELGIEFVDWNLKKEINYCDGEYRLNGS